MKKPNETFVFELPDFFVFYAKLKLFEFLCLIFTWHSIFKKSAVMSRLSEYTTTPPNSQVSLTCSNWVGSFILVPVVGLEPTRSRPRRILNPLRLPFHHTGDNKSYYRGRCVDLQDKFFRQKAQKGTTLFMRLVLCYTLYR